MVASQLGAPPGAAAPNAFSKFRADHVDTAPPPRSPSEDSSRPRRGSVSRLANDDDLALAIAQRAEAQALLEEARKERELVVAESKKIEAANAIIQIQYDELVAAQAEFERQKLGPIGVEMASQTHGGQHVGCQTDASLLDPLVAERAVLVASEKASAADDAFQTHGAMWVKTARQAVHDEARSLGALLASRMEMPAPSGSSSRQLPPTGGPPATLQITWRHHLHDEVRRALEPLRERISGLSPFEPYDGENQQANAYMQHADAGARLLPPPVAEELPLRPHTAGADAYPQMLPPWLLDRSGTPSAPPNSARRHRETGPSIARRMVRASANGSVISPRARPQPPPSGMDAAVPGTTAALPIRLHGQPQSSRGAARALAWSQVDKHAARELSAMRQLLRKQADLLPLVR